MPRDSSVGRAFDCRSNGPWFESGLRENLQGAFNSPICRSKSEPPAITTLMDNENGSQMFAIEL